MKGSDRRARISRTFVAAVATPLPSQSPHVTYFSKIQGNVRLLETMEVDQQMKRRSDHSYTARRFHISKRLEQLSRTRQPIERREGQSERRVRRKMSLHPTGEGDGVYEMELANINKTISGTRLGALSALQILQDMQFQNQQRAPTFHGYDQLVKRIESEIPEVPPKPQDMQNQIRKTRLENSIALRQSTGMEGTRNLEKKIQTIYGGEEGFLDKYRQYQISLLEKIPSYRSRHLTLDYKNQWRI